MQPVYASKKPGEAGYAVNLTLQKMLFNALVVGGETSFVTRKIAPRLFRHGIHMVAHWPYKKANGTFPANVEILIVLTDMVGHSMNDSAIAEANKRGIPIVMGIRKYAVLEQRLREAGYPEIPTFSPKPAVSDKHKPVHPKSEVTEAYVRPLLVPSPEAAAPFIAEAAPMPAPAPVSAPPAPAPVPTPAPSFEVLTPELRRVMEYVAKSPGISNRVLETHGFTRNQAYVLAQKARTLLGITSGVGNANEVYVDRAKFIVTCAAYRLKRAEIPADGVVVRETVAGTRTLSAPRGTERQHSEPVNDASYLTASVVPPVVPAPAPVIVATVPTTEVPPEVLAAAPPRETPPAPHSASKDVKELVQLLRLAMAAENIERLTVTKDAVSFRRIVVEEGEYDV